MVLSVLIPTYNDACFSLVRTLREQLLAMLEEWEIIVADDCSTSQAVRDENAQIASLSGCRIEWQQKNIGRAAIRNYLAQVAKGDWLLFIDSDMVVNRGSFIADYLKSIQGKADCVVYGGYEVNGDEHALHRNLRYVYEKKNAHKHTVEQRQQQPYRDFHTSNFMVSRCVMQQVPFNEAFKLYGFEDVLLGKELQAAGIQIHHIDNPVSFEKYETNEDFLRKTEEAVQTQREFHDLLADYSKLLQAAERIKRLHLSWLLHIGYKLLGSRLRKRLCFGTPNLHLFNLYKLLLINEN